MYVTNEYRPMLEALEGALIRAGVSDCIAITRDGGLRIHVKTYDDIRCILIALKRCPTLYLVAHRPSRILADWLDLDVSWPDGSSLPILLQELNGSAPDPTRGPARLECDPADGA